MRRLAIIIVGLCGALLLAAGLAGCGSSSSTKNNPNTPASITLTPTTASIEPGQVAQLVATVKNSDGIVLFVAVTFTSSTTSVATVATGGNNPGLVCAGTWDSLTAPINCTAGGTGTSTITATAGNLSATATVYVHQHITSVTITPASVDCDSQKQTTSFTGAAFAGATDITSTVGPFLWTSNDTNVVTMASDTSNPNVLNKGTGTAVNPGLATVFATAGGTNSVFAPFTTCPVVSIHAHVSSSTATSFTVAVGSTQALAADVLDSTGAAVTVPLLWTSSSPPTASVNSSGVVTGVAAGSAGITASCSPTNCNNGISPVYSNVVSATVTGTAATQSVYATSSLLNPACSTAPNNTCTSVIPITTNNNTPGTAITLPANQVPNSIVFDAGGLAGYLGSAAGLMILDPSNNSIKASVTNALGKVLAVSPNGNLVIVANPGVDVTVFNVSAGTVQTLPIANAAAADFTADSVKAYIVDGSTLYVFQAGLALRTIALAGAANDVNFLSNGQFAYLAGGGSPVTVRATCDNSQQDTVATPATPTFIRKAPGTLTMAAVDSPNLEIITASPTTPPPPSCPPTLTDALTTVNTGVSFTPNALIVSPDGTKALITSNLNEVTMVNLTNSAVTHIAVTNLAHCFTGGVTLDSSTLYVGCSDGAVHVVNLATGLDSGSPITITFPNQAAGIVPDLVAIRP